MTRSGVLTMLGVVARIALGVILLVAALLKMGDPSLFVQQIRGYDISPSSWAPFLAHAFLAIETLLGIALIVGWRPHWTIPGAAALLVVFMGSIAIAWSQGYTGSCGCFGSHGGGRGPAGALLEDSGFLALAIFSFFTVRHLRGDAFWQRVPSVLAGVLGVAVPLIAPHLPIDGLVTDAHAGVPFDHIVVEGFDGEIEDGAYLVALLDPYGDASAAAVESLNELSDTIDVSVLGITQGTNDDMVAFMLEHDAYFDLGFAPEAAMRRFYRTLPVFLHVENGVIERAWFDRAPAADAFPGSSPHGAATSSAGNSASVRG